MKTINEDFFDNNDLTLSDDIMDDSEIMSNEDMKREADMLMSITICSKAEMKTNTLGSFVSSLKNLFDIFSLFYFELKPKERKNQTIEIYYSLKNSVNPNSFYLLSKIILKYLFSSYYYSIRIEDNELKGNRNVSKNISLDNYLDRNKTVIPELVLAGNFFINNIFELYGKRYSMRKLSLALSKYLWSDSKTLQYIEKYGTLYCFLPLFRYRHTSSTTGKESLHFFMSETDLYYALIINELNPTDNYLLNGNINFKFPSKEIDYNLDDYKKCLKSNAYSFSITDTEDYAKLYDKKPGNYMEYWYDKPFFISLKNSPEINIPAIAIKLEYTL